MTLPCWLLRVFHWEPCQLEWHGDNLWVVCTRCRSKRFIVATNSHESGAE